MCIFQIPHQTEIQTGFPLPSLMDWVVDMPLSDLYKSLSDLRSTKKRTISEAKNPTVFQFSIFFIELLWKKSRQDMGRLKICWKVHFWGSFLHLTPPYSRKVGILMARDLKFWYFHTFRKHNSLVTDFKRLENLALTRDTTLPGQKTSYPFLRERTFEPKQLL